MKAFLLVAILSVSNFASAKVLTYGIMGDAGVWNKDTYAIQKSMKAGKVSHLIMPGDNLYFGKYDDVWSNWRGFRFTAVAIGNHSKSYNEEIEYFNMPGEFYRAKVSANTVFFVLNSDNTKTDQTQLNWLAKSLQNAKEDNIFLVYHHPSYTLTDRHSWKEKERFQRSMRKILKVFRKKITALIVGHDHIASLVMVDGIPMIVSGAAFESFKARDLNYQASDGTRVKTAWKYKGGPHWARLDIDTVSGDIWLNFVRAKPMKVVCSVKLKGERRYLKDNCKR